MSVNLSARQFGQADLVEQVDAILTETGMDPTTLELEITESVVMDQSDVGIRTLGACATWASASCSTTSAPATRRCRT